MPAIYFVAPTQSNIRRIAQDLQKGLYASTYVNFTSALSRGLLEEFAETVAKDGTVEGVEQASPRLRKMYRQWRFSLTGLRYRSMISISTS